MDELAWLHGGELVIETHWYKESPKALNFQMLLGPPTPSRDA